MTRVLLDTHALIWWSEDNPLLSRRAWDAIADDRVQVIVSAVSLFEFINKHRLGRWPEVAYLVANWRDYLGQQNFGLLDVTVDHAVLAGSMPWPHKDPFDRLLVAQALAERVTLISNEKPFDLAGVDRLW